MGTLSFRQLFALLFVSFCALFISSYLAAWTGPTASPPGNNVSAPINVGTASQIKDGVIGVDGLAVFGTTYIQTKLGINDDTPVVALDVAGTARLGDGGEVCQAVTEGALRYNSSLTLLEYCNGVAWMPIGAETNTQTFTSSGTFTVPAYSKLVITAWGGGGGGGGSWSGPNGSNGGDTVVVSSAGTLTARGGGGGNGGHCKTPCTGGAGGTASGGDVNTSGNPGGTGQPGVTGGVGGSAPNGGAGNSAQPPECSTNNVGYPARAGSVPGAGGTGGCTYTTTTVAGGGGSGAYVKKTYYSGQLTTGATITITVGAGGEGGGNGASGARGQVDIAWIGPPVLE